MAKNLSSVMKEMLKEAKGDPDLKNQNFERLEALLQTISKGLEKLACAPCSISKESLSKLMDKLEPIIANENFALVQTALSMLLTYGAIDAGMGREAFLGYMDACYRKYKAEVDAEEDDEDDDE
jgi:hypothetical protein